MRCEFSVNIIGQREDITRAEKTIGKKADTIREMPAGKDECIAIYEFPEFTDIDASDAVRSAISHVVDISSRINSGELFSIRLWCVMHSDSGFAGCWLESSEMSKLSINKIDLVLSFYAYDDDEEM